ncbi:MAG: right-handed parallel beta-helix repeat-containing protein [Nitrospiria bacterium]
MRWDRGIRLAVVATVLAVCSATAAVSAGGRDGVAAEKGARILHVGPGRALDRPSRAARVAKDGDTVEIDAGVYRGDAAVWRQNDLTIRGVGGSATLEAAGAQAEGKAIWVIKGRNTTIEHIDFSGARVPDRNGAGIRQEGAGLTVRHCRFERNENGILTGENPDSDITIEFSEFADNGSGDGRTHNLYIGAVRTFTLRGSYSHHARIGHNVKSRARTNYLLYNRIADEETGTASYAVDLPNGGASFVIGNVIQQGPRTENTTILSYGAEGLGRGTNALYVINNTLFNDRPGGGRFLWVKGGAGPVQVVNNLFIGPGTVLAGRGTLDHNLIAADRAGVLVPAVLGSDILPLREAVDAGIDPGSVNGFSLMPVFQYRHLASQVPRPSDGKVDVGAYEVAPVR